MIYLWYKRLLISLRKSTNIVYFVLADICKETWRKLRDNYRKAKNLRKTKSGQGAKIIKSIKFEKELAFLNSYLNQPQDLQKTNLSVPHNTSDDDLSETVESPAPETTENITNMPFQSVSPSTSSSQNVNLPKKRSKPHPSPMQEYLQFKKAELQQRQHKQEAYKEDPLGAFFSSIAGTVRQFPPHVQIRVKRKIFNLVSQEEESLLNSPAIRESEQLPQQPVTNFQNLDDYQSQSTSDYYSQFQST